MNSTPSDHPPEEDAPAPKDKPEQVRLYRCPHCGQTFFAFFDDTLPHMCAYCQDMTTWQPHEPPTS